MPHSIGEAGASAKVAVLDHVAVLTESLEASLALAMARGLKPGGIQAFPGEGTREAYVGDLGWVGRLLFMTPHGAGPYERALRRRGPGLHHIGLTTEDLEAYVASLAGSGWHLLPQSLATIREARTAWLCRPSVPVLIEVCEGIRSPSMGTLVARLEVPVPPGRPALLEALGVPQVMPSPDMAVWLTIDARREPVTSYLGGAC